MTKGFVVFTRSFDSTCRYYLRRDAAADHWTPDLDQATIFPHQDAFSIARLYRRTGERMNVRVGYHGTVEEKKAEGR